MYSLRVFQKKEGEYTNTHVKMFNHDGSVVITKEDFKNVDWDTCNFQVYPANPATNAFYTTIPQGSTLFLFHGRTGLVLGETSLSDHYIYFKPSGPDQDYRVILCVAENVQKARSSLGLYIN